MRYRLGKKTALRDSRNLKFASFLPPELPLVPEAWDVEFSLPVNVPVPMFANDEYGDCVIAGRAHHTLSFEAMEQGYAIEISSREVLEQYWKEGGGDSTTRPDNGLYILESLKSWRSHGWMAAGKHYDIFAFAEIDRAKIQEVKAAIYLLNGGIGGGLALPLSAQDQFDKEGIWYPVSGREGAPGSWGGHYVAFCGYSYIGPTIKTWGRRFLMTWSFFLKHCDELYGIVDNKNLFMDSALDIGKLADYLRAVTG